MPEVQSIIFCEDVRVELGNKPTLVGVAVGDVVLADPLPAPPLVAGLSKFCMVVFLEGMEGVTETRFSCGVALEGVNVVNVDIPWQRRQAREPSSHIVFAVFSPFPMPRVGTYTFRMAISSRVDATPPIETEAIRDLRIRTA